MRRRLDTEDTVRVDTQDGNLSRNDGDGGDKVEERSGVPMSGSVA